MVSSEVPDSNDPDTDESFDQVHYPAHTFFLTHVDWLKCWFSNAVLPCAAGLLCFAWSSASWSSPTPRSPPRAAANVEPTHGNTLPPCLPDEPPLCGLWRHNAFHVVWSRLQSLIRVCCLQLEFHLHMHFHLIVEVSDARILSICDSSLQFLEYEYHR